jgi:hypothetical protein
MTAPKNGEAPSAMARSGAQENRNDTDIIATLVDAIKARIMAGEIVGALDYPEADRPLFWASIARRSRRHALCPPDLAHDRRAARRRPSDSAEDVQDLPAPERKSLTRHWPEALRWLAVVRLADEGGRCDARRIRRD